MLGGVPVVTAWKRANEWLEEHQYELPSGVTWSPVPALPSSPQTAPEPPHANPKVLVTAAQRDSVILPKVIQLPRSFAAPRRIADRVALFTPAPALPPPRGLPVGIKTGRQDRILTLLAEGEKTVGELALGLSDRPDLYGHARTNVALGKLRKAGKVARVGHLWRLADDRRPVDQARAFPPKKEPEALCRCEHPESWHTEGKGKCEHGCGCDVFRPRVAGRWGRAYRAKEKAEHAPKPCPALSPRAGRRCGRPAIYGDFCVIHGKRRERGIDVLVADEDDAPAKRQDIANKEATMARESPKRDAILAVLANGPMSVIDIAAAIGDEMNEAGRTRTSVAINVMRKQGFVKKAGNRTWGLVASPPAAPAEHKPKSKPQERASRRAPTKPQPLGTNGAALAAITAPTASPVKDALLALKEALKAEHEQKMAALEILLK